LVRLNGIWFAGGKFGLTGKPIQIIVRPKVRMMPGVCQMMMPMMSAEDTEHVVDPAESTTSNSNELNVQVDDSDDEDPDKEYTSPAPVESSVPEPVVEQGEAPIKKRVKVQKK
jgi:hypothetical protein